MASSLSLYECAYYYFFLFLVHLSSSFYCHLHNRCTSIFALCYFFFYVTQVRHHCWLFYILYIIRLACWPVCRASSVFFIVRYLWAQKSIFYSIHTNCTLRIFSYFLCCFLCYVSMCAFSLIKGEWIASSSLLFHHLLFLPRSSCYFTKIWFCFYDCMLYVDL